MGAFIVCCEYIYLIAQRLFYNGTVDFYSSPRFLHCTEEDLKPFTSRLTDKVCVANGAPLCINDRLTLNAPPKYTVTELKSVECPLFVSMYIFVKRF